MSVKEALLRCIVVLSEIYISKEVEAGRATKNGQVLVNNSRIM